MMMMIFHYSFTHYRTVDTMIHWLYVMVTITMTYSKSSGNDFHLLKEGNPFLDFMKIVARVL